MTLEKSSNMHQFMYKRWQRLFPAMLICTVFIVLTLPLVPERPFGIPKLTSVIPGLFFIEPEWIRMATGVDVGLLEASFWSLYVEVKFYLLFGLLYFFSGARTAIAGILGAYVVWLLATYGLPRETTFRFLLSTLSLNQFGWFACGSLCYLYYTTKEKNLLVSAILTGLLSLGSLDLTTKGTPIVGLCILTIFIGTIYADWLKPIFTNRLFMFVGFVSYPLYLIHENMLIALIIKLGNQQTFIPYFALPVLPILFLLLVAYCIANYIEPALQRLLRRRKKAATPATNGID